jgi:hypothetical protein
LRAQMNYFPDVDARIKTLFEIRVNLLQTCPVAVDCLGSRRCCAGVRDRVNLGLQVLDVFKHYFIIQIHAEIL